MYAGTTVTSDTISVQVLAGGHPQPLYRRQDGRNFTAGTPGQPYTIQVTNRTGSRIEVITSVDGRHVLDDEPAHPHACHGIIIGPHADYEFKGWRTSDQQTRKFIFTDPGSSVAAIATGSAEGTGVIGLAVHREQQVTTWPLASWTTDDSSPVAVGAAGPVITSYTGGPLRPRGMDLGTGMGAAQHDPVGRTTFTRNLADPDLIVIGYASGEFLGAHGLLWPADPSPWTPVAPGGTGYARF